MTASASSRRAGSRGRAGRILCLLLGGPVQTLCVGGRDYTFEFSRAGYGGPAVLTKRGEIAAAQPGPRSVFWLAFEAWRAQGERVAGGRCIWAPVVHDMPVFLRLSRRHRLVTPRRVSLCGVPLYGVP